MDQVFQSGPTCEEFTVFQEAIDGAFDTFKPTVQSLVAWSKPAVIRYRKAIMAFGFGNMMKGTSGMGRVELCSRQCHQIDFPDDLVRDDQLGRSQQ